MKKLLFFLIILSIPFAFAHAEESHEETVDGKVVEIEFLPSEPIAEKASIISFEVNDAEGKSVTHIDGSMDITKDGVLLVNDYELHSHGNQFSMTYKFPEEGQYTVTLTISPAKNYENEKFDPIAVIFYVTAEENENPISYLEIGGFIAAFLILGVLVFLMVKKKKH
ncbi:MAG: hypothetical protein Q8R18_05720 [bacterium]|nr:hypothetical protein [bacterium]